MLACLGRGLVCVESVTSAANGVLNVIVCCWWSTLQDTKIRVVLEGPPAPPSPVPEMNETEDESTKSEKVSRLAAFAHAAVPQHGEHQAPPSVPYGNHCWSVLLSRPAFLYTVLFLLTYSTAWYCHAA